MLFGLQILNQGEPMRTSIILTDWQARCKNLGLVVVPVVPQPVEVVDGIPYYGPWAADIYKEILPPWQPGQVLAVREAWDDVHPIRIAKGRYSQPGDAGIPGDILRPETGVKYRIVYRADGELPPIWHCQEYPYRTLTPKDESDLKYWPKGVEFGWMPSTQMPLKFSRRKLRVKSVECKLVSEITEDEAKAAGSPAFTGNDIGHAENFYQHWNKRYGKKHPAWGWFARCREVK